MAFVDALADSFATARTAPQRRAVARRALARTGATPLGDFSRVSEVGYAYEVPTSVSLVAGTVPGRHPIVRTELVMLGARLDASVAPAVIEATRVLAERAKWTSTPGRAVQVVLWDGPVSDQEALAAALRAPLWSRAAVRSVVVVSERVPMLDGVAVVAVPPSGLASLTDALLGAVLARADVAPDSVVVSDSVAAR